ncbi:DUF4158 domain-containing protein [Yinghuangia sp. ASG 101]|uniref:DUF4158 domain-containing protein n=1 Tax=Yinghuangia sp. ASG 101 TaxID=2896848 RepID=UPI003FCCFFE6
MVEYVAEQLGLAPAALAGYGTERTRCDHQQAIKDGYRYQDLAGPAWWKLSRWLWDRAWSGNERPIALFDLATLYLVENKVLLPGATVLERLSPPSANAPHAAPGASSPHLRPMPNAPNWRRCCGSKGAAASRSRTGCGIPRARSPAPGSARRSTATSNCTPSAPTGGTSRRYPPAACTSSPASGSPQS